jgi:hypothetical protein
VPGRASGDFQVEVKLVPPKAAVVVDTATTRIDPSGSRHRISFQAFGRTAVLVVRADVELGQAVGL